jgi:hypothetical protein
VKATVYLRVAIDENARTARGRQPRFAVTQRPSDEPIYDGTVDRHALPTVAFGIELDIPDALFERAGQVIAELTIPEDQATIAAEVKQP